MAINSAKIRPAKKLRIRLISGHHLPKTSRKLKGNVIEPYVQIKIHGHSIDQNEITSTVVPKVSCPAYTADFRKIFESSNFEIPQKICTDNAHWEIGCKCAPKCVAQ